MKSCLNQLSRIALPLITALLASAPAKAADIGGVFNKGRTHFMVTGGTGYAFDESYFVLGVGGSYYVLDGLNVGLNVESWSGANPGMTKVTPSVQYVLQDFPVVKPYAGLFFRRTYIENLPDLDSAGGRAGAYLAAGSNMFLGAGVVYESYLDCTTTVYRSCSDTYPELSFTIAF